MLFYESERSDQHNYLYCQRDHNFNFPAHLHHSFEFLCVQSGTLACTLETEQYEVHPGEALLVLPDQIHSYRTIGESQSVLWVFSNDWVPEFISQLGQREFITPVFRMEAAPLMELLWPGGNRCKQLAGLYLICGTAVGSTDQLDSILSNASIFGSDLTKTVLADKVKAYFKAEIAGPGAVRKTLHEAVNA